MSCYYTICPSTPVLAAKSSGFGSYFTLPRPLANPLLMLSCGPKPSPQELSLKQMHALAGEDNAWNTTFHTDYKIPTSALPKLLGASLQWIGSCYSAMPKQKRRPTAGIRHRRLRSPRSIRLLNLHPSSNLSAPLNASLFEASLDDFPSDRHGYEALSYVWGAPTGSVPCTCDGKRN